MSTSVDEVIRAIVALGGTYPDVVQALQQAKTDGALVSRFEVDALPESGRVVRPHGGQRQGRRRECAGSGARSSNTLDSKWQRRCPICSAGHGEVSQESWSRESE